MIEWVEKIVEEVGEKEHVIATGVSPSGPIHIGNMREVLIADAVYKRLVEKGIDAKFIYIVDTYDPLRRLYPFLPKEFEEHVGKPLSEIPDPWGCCPNYADHFLIPFLESMEKLGVELDVFKAGELYRSGRYSPMIKIALQRRNEIASIIDEVAGKSTPPDWSPFNPICKSCGRLTRTKVKEVLENGVVYRCECGHEGTASFDGGGKLTWRVDWPARWKMFGVTIEPFGKDLAVAGGSYESGRRISREIFGYEPPYPIPFEHILLKGEGKMSSSRGIAITPSELLEVMPPDALYMMITQVKPRRHIEFDPSSIPELLENMMHRKVPFTHLVTIVQVSKDPKERIEILKRSGYSPGEDVIRDMEYAERWLEKYAPESVKFSVMENVPPEARKLSDDQRKALRILAERIEGKSADEIHNEVYNVAKEIGMDAPRVFEAIYIAILGKKRGPRAGFFLRSLDPKFVKERFKSV